MYGLLFIRAFVVSLKKQILKKDNEKLTANRKSDGQKGNVQVKV